MQKPKWEIKKEEFLRRLNFTEKDFEAKLSLPDLKAVAKVIPLRDMPEIESIAPLSQALLWEIIRKIKTFDGQRPFTNSKMYLGRIDARQLKIGQKFVYREKYQGLLENLPQIIKKFAIADGLCDLGAYLFFGIDTEGKYAMAFYIPPMIEQHNSEFVIMDGVNRNYLNKQTSPSAMAIIIKNVSVEFPCDLQDWDNTCVIGLAHKPEDMRDRYFNLKENLFRDLKFLGIDG
ncbi:MAG: hypothetical protein AAB522_02490 [Patescibacteria group bacterium]